MPGDVVDVPISPITVAVAAGATGEYLLVSPQEGVQPPAEGFGLLVVMPGGDGSADFHPFVRRIHANSLNDSFLVAQPLAVKWTPEQQIVWSTAKNAVTGAKFTTEQLVAAVVDDVAKKQKLNRKRVYLLAWSSGGPAAYATLLQAESPATGGLIAMSVFKPDLLPPLSNAKGRGFYLLQSPDDTVCPYWMAEGASKSLAEAGGRRDAGPIRRRSRLAGRRVRQHPPRHRVARRARVTVGWLGSSVSEPPVIGVLGARPNLDASHPRLRREQSTRFHPRATSVRPILGAGHSLRQAGAVTAVLIDVQFGRHARLCNAK